MDKEKEQLIAEIVKMLFDAKANKWTVQEKGILQAAIKQQLAEK